MLNGLCLCFTILFCLPTHMHTYNLLDCIQKSWSAKHYSVKLSTTWKVALISQYNVQCLELDNSPLVNVTCAKYHLRSIHSYQFRHLEISIYTTGSHNKQSLNPLRHYKQDLTQINLSHKTKLVWFISFKIIHLVPRMLCLIKVLEIMRWIWNE
jgi:hypothetical protein